MSKEYYIKIGFTEEEAKKLEENDKKIKDYLTERNKKIELYYEERKKCKNLYKTAE